MESLKMQKVLIFGARGMLGHIAAQYLKQQGCYEVIPCVRNANNPGEVELDVTDFSQVKSSIQKYRPDIVLNCVGMLVKACLDRPDMAILINSYFPQFLAHLGKDLNYKLIHISTDCVFSGKKGNYRDTDYRDGDTPYARTKALGEIIDDCNLTIRTSIVGPELKNNGTGLFHWFMQQHGEIKGFTHAYWSGVTTLELSKCIHAAIQQNLIGLYQLSMPEKISKYGLLKLFQKVWEKDDVTIIPCNEYFCDKSMVISSQKSFQYSIPMDYETMLSEMKTYLNNNYLGK